jgi:hypothetical protein
MLLLLPPMGKWVEVALLLLLLLPLAANCPPPPCPADAVTMGEGWGQLALLPLKALMCLCFWINTGCFHQGSELPLFLTPLLSLSTHTIS